MLKKGIYLTTTKRNEKTGFSVFKIKENEETVICCGIIPSYPKYIPLELNGEYNDKIFEVSSVRVCQIDTSSTIDFMCSKTFNGVGPYTVNEIMDKTNLDVFEYLRQDKPLNIFKKDEKNAVNIIKDIIDFEKVYNYIVDAGGSYYEAYHMFKNYGGVECLNTIKLDPYSLIKVKAPFGLCEKIAKDSGLYACDKRRIKAIVCHVINQSTSNGNTYISFTQLCNAIHKLEEQCDCDYYTEPIFIAEEVLSQEYTLKETFDNVLIFKKNDYLVEEKIIEQINRLNGVKEPIVKVDAYKINQIENMCSIKYSLEQKFAMNSCEYSGIKIIRGGPGTGKTTLLNGILTLLESNNKDIKIKLAAPTGCASRRMAESTGRDAYTIYKAINIKPSDNLLNVSVEKSDADVWVIDEMSMTDMYVFYKLLTCIKTGALVILLGDENQLPPVGLGNVFKDLINSNMIEKYQLKTIYRQESLNSIVLNSYKIINGDNNLTHDDNFVIKYCENDTELVKTAVEEVKKLTTDDYKVYSSCRNPKFEASTTLINKKLKIKDEKRTSFEYGFNSFSVGDKIIFTRNNYAKNYFNGEEGVITFIQNHSNTSHVTIQAEDEQITISGTDLDDIELGYALTAHKSQGGECDTAVIVIPSTPVSMLKRQLLYVEVTRARKKVILITNKNTLNKTISSYGEYDRNTGLIEKMILSRGK